MKQFYRSPESLFQKFGNQLPLLFPIMGSHINRLGIFRVLVGAMGMYLSIPVFLVIHALIVSLALRWVIHPILRLESLDMQNYVILDRYKVSGLSFIDKTNCLFCGWANGLCTLMDKTIDHIAENPQRISLFYKTILTFLCVLFFFPSLLIQILFFYIYNCLIAAPLCLEKVYYGKLIQHYFFNDHFASKYAFWAKKFLCYQKITWTGLNMALMQIEAAWCPIKHFEKMEGVIYPDHHKLFFEPHQVDEMRQFLSLHHSVMERDI